MAADKSADEGGAASDDSDAEMAIPDKHQTFINKTRSGRSTKEQFIFSLKTCECKQEHTLWSA